MTTKILKFDEMPKDVKNEFYLIRIDEMHDLILEKYKMYENGTWENFKEHKFSVGLYELEKVLEEVKKVIPKLKVIYIEEGTLGLTKD